MKNVPYKLNIKEFDVLDQYLLYEDENTIIGYFFEVVPNQDPENCPCCHSGNYYRNGVKIRTIQDYPVHFVYPTFIKIFGNRFVCKNCGKSFVQEFDCVERNAKITKRLANEIYKWSTCSDLTNYEIALKFSVSTATLYRILNEQKKQNS